MCKVLNALFRELEDLLYVPTFELSLASFSVPVMRATTLSECIAAALPDLEILTLTPVTAAEVVRNVELALPCHPTAAEVLDSPRYLAVLRRLTESLEGLAANSTALAKFTFTQPHPYYGLIMSFAYVFVTPDGGEVIVGSSTG